MYTLHPEPASETLILQIRDEAPKFIFLTVMIRWLYRRQSEAPAVMDPRPVGIDHMGRPREDGAG